MPSCIDFVVGWSLIPDWRADLPIVYESRWYRHSSLLSLLVLRWPFKRHQLFHLLYSSSPLSSSGMVSKLKILFCHLDSDFPWPLTSASFHTTSPRDLADNLDMELKFLALDQSIPSSWSASHLRSLSTCNTTLSILPLPPTFVSTPYFINRRDAITPTIMVHRCLINAGVLLSSHPSHLFPLLSWSSTSLFSFQFDNLPFLWPLLYHVGCIVATHGGWWSSTPFEGLTGPSSSLFMTSWSRIGFCRNERMYFCSPISLPIAQEFLVLPGNLPIPIVSGSNLIPYLANLHTEFL